jgi:hypothetical protein
MKDSNSEDKIEILEGSRSKIEMLESLYGYICEYRMCGGLW